MVTGQSGRFKIDIEKLQSAKSISDLQSILENVHMTKGEIRRHIVKGLAVKAITILEERQAFEDSPIELDVDAFTKEVLSSVDHYSREVTEEVANLVLVCSSPTRFLKIIEELGIMFTEDVFRSLFSTAQSELLIVSPFMEREGIHAFRGELLEAAKKEVKVKLITRSPADKKLALALYDLFEIMGELIEVRVYHTEFQMNLEIWRQLESTHAKLIIKDRKEMYIGSAEIRPNALYNNFELGVLIRNNTLVDQALDVFNTFWDDPLYAKHVSKGEISDIISKVTR